MMNRDADRHAQRRRGARGGTANPSPTIAAAPTLLQRLWSVLNSPLVLLLISGVVIAGGAKLYADRQAAAAELSARRDRYVELLAEIQHRVGMLQQADGLLDPFIGSGEGFEAMKPVPEPWPLRAAFDRACLKAGRIEADVLAGRGGYVPTAPAFAGTDMLTLAARLERLGRVPDLQLGSIRMIGLLSVPPDGLWLFVRAYMPTLMRFVASRHLLNVDGQLPLPAGAVLTVRQEAMLGIPQVHPGDLERIERENDRLFAQVDRKLRDAASDKSGTRRPAR